jgi:hypothetical protein
MMPASDRELICALIEEAVDTDSMCCGTSEMPSYQTSAYVTSSAAELFDITG